jgi:hypothetical protein
VHWKLDGHHLPDIIRLHPGSPKGPVPWSPETGPTKSQSSTSSKNGSKTLLHLFEKEKEKRRRKTGNAPKSDIIYCYHRFKILNCTPGVDNGGFEHDDGFGC